MGFFTGSMTYQRFSVQGNPPQRFTEEHLEMIKGHLAGEQRKLSSDGVEVGWCAGAHIFDLDFTFEKNIINDMLVFAMRIDTTSLPGDLMRAYYATDLKALAAENPSGIPSARQKREAKESARDRLEEEAKDGRYTKRKMIEVVWDLKSNDLLFGTTSTTQIDRLLVLWNNTFNVGFQPINAETLAYTKATARNNSDGIANASPANFVPGVTPTDIRWIPDYSNRQFLGNEFFMWLWYQCDVGDADFNLQDNSIATVMISNRIELDCPRGMNGNEVFTHEGPTKLPEAKKAIEVGKWPRKVGLTIVRHGVDYQLKLQAETFAVSGAKIPSPDEDDPRAKLEARADQIRDMIETVDLLYGEFIALRADSSEWAKELAKINKWLGN